MAFAARLAGQARAVLAALCLIGAPSAAFAQCADPLAMAVEYGAMNFVQTRHLSGLRAPLVARGRAEIAPQRIDWRVTEPVSVLTTITPTGMTQSVEGGPPQRIGAGGDAFLSSAGLSRLLSGDLAGLSTQYRVERAPAAADGAWRLRLTPRTEAFARFVSRIEVAGCDRVSHVEVRQANGDWMEIALSPLES